MLLYKKAPKSIARLTSDKYKISGRRRVVLITSVDIRRIIKIMKVAGIVAEYNPFHNGHKYQIDTLKSNGFTHIVTAMSGNFVQRGDVAIVDKWLRTALALSSGVDLVFEIPTCYCLAPAEKYCFSAVEILKNSGIVDNLCFGSETGDINKLSAIADILSDKAVDEKIKEHLKSGITYAAARENAVKELYKNTDFAYFLKNPNDVLGIEYLRALKSLKSDIKPLAIRRIGVAHDDRIVTEDFASASKIREMIKSGEDYANFMPENHAFELKRAKNERVFPVFLEDNERVILSLLRNLKEEDFASLCDVSEGFHNRLFSAVREADSLEKLYSLAKTKRYTLARIRRLIMNSALGIFAYEKPPYLRVLGFSENGKELLSLIKEKSDLPIVTSFSEAKKLSTSAENYFKKEARYTDFYSMLMPKIAQSGMEFSRSIVKI